MPLGLVELIAPHVGSVDTIGKCTFYRIYDTPKKSNKQGAMVLIRKI